MYDMLFNGEYPELVMLGAAIMMFLIFLPAIFPKLNKLLGGLLKYIVKKPEIKDESLKEIIDELGYVYDSRQDIFYSGINAWQRGMGYCRLYDEAAAHMSMIIDCEPIYFEYDNRRWLIEFWKGQYGMTTGCEVGIYSTDEPDIMTEYFNGTFYECAGDDDLLSMSLQLFKNGKKLLKRSGIHWWLTGFKIGEYSEPEELAVFITLKLKDSIMRTEFVKGLIRAGYNEKEIAIVNNTVRFVFEKPRTQQPYTRNDLTDYIMQSNNKYLIDKFNELTKTQKSSIDKIAYLKSLEPELFEKFYHMLGRNKDVFSGYWDIQNQL